MSDLSWLDQVVLFMNIYEHSFPSVRFSEVVFISFVVLLPHVVANSI